MPRNVEYIDKSFWAGYIALGRRIIIVALPLINKHGREKLSDFANGRTHVRGVCPSVRLEPLGGFAPCGVE